MARLLLVDDDPDLLLLQARCLEAAGHEVHAVSDPHQLPDPEPFDAAVLDVVMPERSGYDLLRELRRSPSGRDLPVLFVSARGDSPDRIRGLREGADDFLPKPFDPEELVLRVERLLRPRRLLAADALPTLEDLDRAVRTDRFDGVTLGRYAVRSLVGRGSSGWVFLGRDPELERNVALKTLRRDLFALLNEEKDPVQGLLDEAKTLARFSHPNIVSIYDVGRLGDGSPFFAIEYVAGVSLAAYLAACRTVSPAGTLVLAREVATGLDAAHSRGVVHGDVKPGNILLSRDAAVKIGDFGIAAFLTRTVAPHGRVFGTPGFIAPEVILGDGFDARSDLFSLGVVLYKCLQGSRPFDGRSVQEVVRRTCLAEPLPLEVDGSALAVSLAQMIDRLLQKRPQDRPESARAVLEELERLPPSEPWAPHEHGFEALDEEDGSEHSLLLPSTHPSQVGSS